MLVETLDCKTGNMGKGRQLCWVTFIGEAIRPAKIVEVDHNVRVCLEVDAFAVAELFTRRILG